MALKSKVEGPIKPSPEKITSKRHIREIRLEGMMLHARTIIEQGRTKEFLETCERHGFITIKGQAGLVKFVRDFVNSGDGMQRSTPITGENAQKFTLATQKKTRKIDHC